MEGVNMPLFYLFGGRVVVFILRANQGRGVLGMRWRDLLGVR